MSENDASTQESNDEYHCPWDGCDRVFDSDRGVKSHHKKSHGVSIAGVTVECEWCNQSKLVTPKRAKETGRFFCDQQCAGEWRSDNWNAEDAPAWKGGEVEVECAWCGESKSVRRSHANSRDHHFCDQECLSEWKSEQWGGENNPNWGRVEVECAWCGSSKLEIASKVGSQENHFCDNECRADWLSENVCGENGANWRGGNIEVECSWCSEPKLVYPAVANLRENHFCDRGCFGNWLSENRSGEDAYSWRGGDVTVECAWCGTLKSVSPYLARSSERHFCDQTCLSDWRSENRSGENSPCWKGGVVPYGPGWNETKREQVRERDGRKCQNCGRPEGEHIELCGRKHSVHHIQKARVFDDPERRNDPQNLITLCQIPPEGSDRPCHAEWERMSPLRPQISDVD